VARTDAEELLTRPRRGRSLRADAEALARSLRAMRDAVEAGELTATRGERAYIEGAVDALDGLLGRASQTRQADRRRVRTR
jgi:hypothetical protein